MKIAAACFQCADEKGATTVAVVELKDDGRHEATCKNGHRIWLESLLPQLREMLWTAALDALVRERPQGTVLPTFLSAVASQLGLLPVAQAAFLRTCEGWERTRLR